MTEIGSKYYTENQSRVPYIWLHYYPPCQPSANTPIKDFFKSIFPSTSDKLRVDTVHQNHKTECIAIAIHDKEFDNQQFCYCDCCHILSAVSFTLVRQSKKDTTTGAYIYYLGTLPDIGFHEILPGNKIFKELKFLVEGNGFAPKLLRIVQELSYMIRPSRHLFLGAHVHSVQSEYKTMLGPSVPSNLVSFYHALKFITYKSWDDVPPEIKICAEMETEDIDELVPMHLKDYIIPSSDNAQRLLTRHGNKFMRNIQINENYEMSRSVKTVMKQIHQTICNLPHTKIGF